MFWPCETRTSICRNLATISSGLYRFLAITVLLDVKDIPQVGPLQWGWIIFDCMLPATLSIESVIFWRLRARSATADILCAFQRRSAPWLTSHMCSNFEKRSLANFISGQCAVRLSDGLRSRLIRVEGSRDIHSRARR